MAVMASATPILFTTLNTCARSFSHSKSTITRRRISSLRASTSPLEVCVKESINIPGKLGDCPFSQRVLLTLEEKHLGYDMKLINTANKPEWFFVVNPEGKVPVINLEGKWIADSDVIAQSLEEKYPDRDLVTPPEKASVGSGIFSAFIGFLKSKDPADGTQEALIKELTLLDDYIKQNGPFINGSRISAADLSLGPKLYHMEIALGHYKNWSLPESLTNANSYIQSIFSRESFVKTRALREDVIAGWSSKAQT
ncbi:Glutathione S-transferase DHAR3, chloroplastic [Zostera marina]|uniref:Glutathione S-transferase DHAR3, chloroplastic n=1 Tax=Zostera marina TaxID=29655 RepID=A0A0K9P629_ZOSMR|nr:Glutathione S-transferase DHAR3, chloroplastic [Zostera marina]